MADIAIRVENLSKLYRIGVLRRRHNTLRDSIVAAITGSIRQLRNRKPAVVSDATIWALRNVSFDVKQGEVLGIIGRNGAGKSTLLKILSRITEPTEGRIEVHGRVRSLLEVGTGFHSELTGRDNVYLNGVILGMKKSEIDRKFDEILAFAEVEKFIDTPVKHYSSGMYLRLAFAVAAHLEPDILLVDEVLAVGDFVFQKKCLSKMQNIGQEGCTILFVSHNMPAIRTLCPRSIFLEKGIVQCEGETPKVIEHYLGKGNALGSEKVWIGDRRPGNETLRLDSIKLKNASGNDISTVNISEEILVEVEYEMLRESRIPHFSLTLFDGEGYCAFSSHNNTDPYYHGKKIQPGQYKSICYIYGNLLNSGRFNVSITAASAYWSDSFHIDHVISFEALDDGVLKDDYAGRYGGVVRPKLMWETIPVPLTLQGNQDKGGNAGKK